MSVEQIRHRLRTELREMSQPDIQDGFDDGVEQIGIGTDPPDLGGDFVSIGFQLAPRANLAIIAQG
jgi:hypothetical protein